MRLGAGLAATAALVLTAPIHAGEADDWGIESFFQYRSPWESCGVGTMVHHRTITEFQHPFLEKHRDQLPAPPRFETEVKRTLLKLTKDSVVVKTEQSLQGKWKERTSTLPRQSTPPKVEDAGEGIVLLADKPLRCKKKRLTWERYKEVVVFVHEKHGVVRVDTIRPIKTVLQLKRLNVPLAVAGTKLMCREYALSSISKGMTGTKLLSLQVPGLTVRLKRTSSKPGSQKVVRVVTELIGFKREKSAATQPGTR